MTLEVPVTLEHLSNKEEAHAALYDIDDEFSCVNIMTNSKNEIFYVDDNGAVIKFRKIE